jgi:hypothetical protein
VRRRGESPCPLPDLGARRYVNRDIYPVAEYPDAQFDSMTYYQNNTADVVAAMGVPFGIRILTTDLYNELDSSFRRTGFGPSISLYLNDEDNLAYSDSSRNGGRLGDPMREFCTGLTETSVRPGTGSRWNAPTRSTTPSRTGCAGLWPEFVVPPGFEPGTFRASSGCSAS